MRTLIASFFLTLFFFSPVMAEDKRCNFTESLHSQMLYRGGGLVATTGSASSHVLNCSLADGFYIGTFFLTPHQNVLTGVEGDLWLGWTKSWGNVTLDFVIEADYFSVKPGLTMAAVVPKATVSYKITSGPSGSWRVYAGLEAAEFFHGSDGFDRRVVVGSEIILNLNKNLSWGTDLHAEFHDTTFTMQYGKGVYSVKTGPTWTFGDQSFGLDLLGVHGGFGPDVPLER